MRDVEVQISLYWRHSRSTSTSSYVKNMSKFLHSSCLFISSPSSFFSCLYCKLYMNEEGNLLRDGGQNGGWMLQEVLVFSLVCHYFHC